MANTVRRVVVPIDYRPPLPLHALEEARALTGAVNRVYVVHVLPAVERDDLFPWGTVAGESRQAYAMRALRERLDGTPFVEARLSVCFGDIARCICDKATEVRAEIIVMASRGGAGGLGQMITGTVTQRVVRLAEVPVLVLRADRPELRLVSAPPQGDQPRAEEPAVEGTPPEEPVSGG